MPILCFTTMIKNRHCRSLGFVDRNLRHDVDDVTYSTTPIWNPLPTRALVGESKHLRSGRRVHTSQSTTVCKMLQGHETIIVSTSDETPFQNIVLHFQPKIRLSVCTICQGRCARATGRRRKASRQNGRAVSTSYDLIVQRHLSSSRSRMILILTNTTPASTLRNADVHLPRILLLA